jgi:transposase
MDREADIKVWCNVRGNDFDYFLRRVEPYRHDLTVCCESTFNWYWLADACMDADIEFVLGHALYLSSVRGGKHKNDKEDSKELADCLRSNRLPPGYVYPREKRPARMLLRRRMKYVWMRSGHMAHSTNSLMVEGLDPVSCGQHNRDRWRDALKEQHRNDQWRLAVDCDAEMIKQYDRCIGRMERAIVAYAKEHMSQDLWLLRSVPGIGDVLGMTILYETDTVERFPSPEDFSSYCRLVKGSVSSAGQIKGLKGGKLGNPYLKWALMEAVTIMKRHERVKKMADRLEAKYGKQVGNAVLANRLARAIYSMLSSKQPFDLERFVTRRSK